ncbi:MAG: DUF2147 domain-containing protein [Bacteroidota bacterium]|nr:DUF2147 domain-containing protein [Bacteroidota bacterium]
MKNISLSVLIFFIPFICPAQINPDAIVGKWITTAGNCMVEVYKQNTEFKAKILWFNDKGKKPMNDWKDEKNPDASLRNRKLVGMEVLNGLHYNSGEKQWVDGIIYDASTGKKWDSVVWLTDDNLLKVKGYWVFKFLSETKTFKRA